MRRFRQLACMVLALVALLSCGEDAGFEYSNYHCNLTLDNSTHQDPTLASAMNAMTAGIFCKIGFTVRGGASYYTFVNNQNAQTESIFNAIDARLENQNRIGMNRGLIVGYGNLDHPAVFFAYDAECPNCFSVNALPLRSYPLSVSGTGVASCAHCKNEYNLNTGGNLVKGSGVQLLTRYHANQPEPFGVLQVY